MALLPELEDIFASDGLLAKAFPGFIQRAEQLSMAELIEQGIKHDKNVCIEAGTGTGKTFAYLVPVLKSWQLENKKAIISTGTKNLQDQLYFRDLPSVCDALCVTPTISLLKGRSNYLCLYRLEHNIESGLFQSRSMVETIQKVKEWSYQSQTGDLTQCSELLENDPLWPMVTSTNENCLGSDCPLYDDCFVAKARQKAIASDLVVVNHHLLLADMVLKEDGFGELLPEADSVIVDEAHQLLDIAHNFYGQRFASRMLLDICRDGELEAMTTAKDDRQLSVSIRRVEGAINEIRLCLGETGIKVKWEHVVSEKLMQLLEDLMSELKVLCGRFEINASRSKGLDSCHKRSLDCLQLLKIFKDSGQQEESVRWVETYRSGFAILETPLNVSEAFQQSQQEQSASSWIFTSATISQADGFEHFNRQLGIENALELVLNSPFDYKHQSLLHIPRNIPDPRANNYIEAWQAEVLPIVKANPGGTFVLFTSYFAMHKVRDLWAQQELGKKLLVQGDRAKNQLIEEFREDGKAILLATSSFWEGVDVKGMALSCVIIDKLPFTAPDEPLIEAKINHLRKTGKNPFFDLQIPEAIIALKQGAGRLIRDHQDRGVLILCDPRLIANYYGKRFLQSLPLMPRTRNSELVVEFLKKCDTA